MRWTVFMVIFFLPLLSTWKVFCSENQCIDIIIHLWMHNGMFEVCQTIPQSYCPCTLFAFKKDSKKEEKIYIEFINGKHLHTSKISHSKSNIDSENTQTHSKPVPYRWKCQIVQRMNEKERENGSNSDRNRESEKASIRVCVCQRKQWINRNETEI